MEEEIPIKKIDEMPIGKSNQEDQWKDAFKDGVEEAQEIVEVQIPLKDKLNSKVMKKRQEGFKELIELYEKQENTEPIFLEHCENFKIFAADSNVMCQELALKAISLWVKKMNPPYDTVDILELSKIIIEKALSNDKKKNIKDLAENILLDLFEKNFKDEIKKNVLSNFANKNQKIVLCCINFTVCLLINFGLKHLDMLHPYFEEIEKLATNARTSSVIKTAYMEFYKEAYKWVGTGIEVRLKKALSADQLKVMETYQKETELGSMVPLRNPQEQVAANKGDFDPYETADPQDIFNKFNENWVTKNEKIEKWKERKNALDELITEMEKYPKLLPSGFFHVVNMTKKLLKENNFNLLQAGIKIAGLLASGLRNNFVQAAKILFEPVFSKLKVQKTFIQDETTKSLKNMLSFCITIEDTSESFKSFLKDKNGQLKVSILKLLEILFQKNSENTEKGLKELLPTLVKLVDDPTQDVRDKAMAFIGKMKNAYDNKFFGKELNGVDKKKQDIINSYVKEEEPAENNLMQIEQVGAGTTLPGQKKKNGPQQVVQTLVILNFTCKFADEAQKITYQDSEEKLIGQGIDEGYLKQFDSPDQNIRLKAFQKLDLDSVSENKMQYLLCFLKQKSKEWKEGNANINQEICNICIKILNNYNIEKVSYLFFLQFIVEKISDPKFDNKLAIEILKPLGIKLHPYSIVVTFLEIVEQQKKPMSKTLESVSIILIKLIQIFTVDNLPIERIIKYASTQLNHAQNPVKQAATNLFKFMYTHMDRLIHKYLDLPQQALRQLQQQFEGLKVLLDNEKQIMVKIEVEEDPVQQYDIQQRNNIQKSNISNDIQQILPKVSDKDQKKRKEACEELNTLLVKAKYKISLNGCNALITDLKPRINDNNKAISRAYINFIGRFAEAGGKEVSKYAKLLIPALIQNLQDRTTLNRQETINCLEIWGDIIGMEQIFLHTPEFLAQDKPDLRIEILNMMLRSSNSLSKLDIKKFVDPVMQCVTCRNNIVKNLATDVLKVIIANDLTYVQLFNQYAENQKPAAQESIKEILCQIQNQCINDGMNIEQPGENNGEMFEENQNFNNGGINYNTEILQNQSQNFNNQNQQISNNNNKSFINNSMPQMNNQSNYQQQLQQQQQDNDMNLPPKQKRQMLEQQNPWPVNTLDDQLIEQLKVDLLNQGFQDELYYNLVSFSYDKNIIAANYIGEYLQTGQEISDILIKWSFWKMFGVSIKDLTNSILAMLKKIVIIFGKEAYFLEDYETFILLNTLKYYIFHNYMNNYNQDIIMEINKQLSDIVNSDKIVKFWIDSLQGLDDKFLIENILRILTTNFITILKSHISVLGQNSLINSNSIFIDCLITSGNYDQNGLKMAGFKINQINNNMQQQQQQQQQQILNQNNFQNKPQIKNIPHISPRLSRIRHHQPALQNGAQSPLQEKFQQLEQVQQELHLQQNNSNTNNNNSQNSSLNNNFRNLDIENKNIFIQQQQQQQQQQMVQTPTKEQQQSPNNRDDQNQNLIEQKIQNISGSAQKIQQNDEILQKQQQQKEQEVLYQQQQQQQILQQQQKEEEQKQQQQQLQIEEEQKQKQLQLEQQKQQDLQQQQYLEQQQQLDLQKQYEEQQNQNIITNQQEQQKELQFNFKNQGLDQIFQVLLSDNIQIEDKKKSLSNGLFDFISAKDEVLFTENAEEYILQISQVFKKYISQKPISEINADFYELLLNVLTLSFQTIPIIQNISQQNLLSITNMIFNQLLYENEKNVEATSKGLSKGIFEKTGKQLNSLILKLLDNSVKLDMLKTLYSLLQQYTKNIQYHKSQGLISKCILKIGKTISAKPDQFDCKQCLIILKDYLDTVTNLSEEEISVKAIKILLHELIKVFGLEKVQSEYQEFLNMGYQDSKLSNWILILNNDINQQVPQLNKQNIQEPQNQNAAINNNNSNLSQQSINNNLQQSQLGQTLHERRNIRGSVMQNKLQMPNLNIEQSNNPQQRIQETIQQVINNVNKELNLAQLRDLINKNQQINWQSLVPQQSSYIIQEINNFMQNSGNGIVLNNNSNITPVPQVTNNFQNIQQNNVYNDNQENCSQNQNVPQNSVPEINNIKSRYQKLLNNKLALQNRVKNQTVQQDQFQFQNNLNQLELIKNMNNKRATSTENPTNNLQNNNNNQL